MEISKYSETINRTLHTLDVLGLCNYTQEAHDLILMTALHESGGLKYKRQVGGGPALGYGQMESATHEDLYVNYLRYRPLVMLTVKQFLDGADTYETAGVEIPYPELLVNNDVYCILMMRLHYLRVPQPLPKATADNYLRDLSEYCKEHYNKTGKATPEKYLEDYLLYMSKTQEELYDILSDHFMYCEEDSWERNTDIDCMSHCDMLAYYDTYIEGHK